MTKFALLATIALGLATPAYAQDTAPEPRTNIKTVTTDKGTYTSTKTYDPTSQTSTRDRSVIGVNGETASSNVTRQKTDTGYTASGTRTGFDGKTSNYNSDFTRNGDGTATFNSSGTGKNGTTGQVSNTITKTETGYTAQGAYSNSRGAGGTTSGSLERTTNGFNRSASAVNNAGETVYRRDASVARTETGVNRSVNRQGQVPGRVKAAGRRR